jgi:hypothetical protein
MAARIVAEELYHAFTVIPRMRYRVVVYAEQRVQGRWIQMSTTKLATLSPARNRDPMMPSRPPPPPPPAASAEDQVVLQGPPPPPPPPAAEDQVVPQGDPMELADTPYLPPLEDLIPKPPQPSSDAPGPMRHERRAREERRSPPPRPSQPPLARRPPRHHQMMVPSWAVLANDIWFACPMCTESVVHSGVVCGQCGGRPACCRCMALMEVSRHSEGRCLFCRYSGPQ